MSRANAGALVDSKQSVYLTFDDGPNLFCTPKILDVLRENHAAATFCVIGQYAAECPEAVRRVVAEGHSLANHTMTHPDFSRCRPEKLRWEIAEANRVIESMCPQAAPGYLRAPYGVWTDEARAVAAECELTPLDWSVDPRDWSRPGVDAIVEAVLSQAKPGGIILLHDGCPPDELPSGDCTSLRDQTVEALRRLIPALRERGFDFPPLPAPYFSRPSGSSTCPGADTMSYPAGQRTA